MSAHPPPPQPFVFGTDADLFGWWHAPLGTPRGPGVVLAPPLGYEELCTHRTYGQLAEVLAAAGLPVVRFDWHGTGDSLGSDENSERVRAWRASLAEAIGALKRATGDRQVNVVGLRFGGTLAALECSQRTDVKGLVLLAAPIAGKAHLRELKALALTQPKFDGAPPPDPARAGDFEVAGFCWSEATVADLSRIDLTALSTRPAERVLLCPRDDMPADGKWARSLSGAGVPVTEGVLKGYAEFMRDAHDSRPPLETWSAVRDFLLQGAEPNGATLRAPARGRLETHHFTEEPIHFGLNDRLFGVRTSPKNSPTHHKTQVLFVNTGSNHHIGSNRMWVTLARKLAAQGFACTRVDVAGIGDSRSWPGKPENRLYSKDSCADVRAAIDALERFGSPDTVLVGLCSGAYLSFHTAVEDTRVKALVLLNAQRFTWNEGDSLEIAVRSSFKSTNFYLDEVMKKETWARVLKGDVNVRGIARTLARRGLERVKSRAATAQSKLMGLKYDVSEVARGFGLLSDRGTKSVLVYSASDGGLDELDKHLGKDASKLEGRENVSLHIITGADHTLTARWAQDHFTTLVERALEGLP